METPDGPVTTGSETSSSYFFLAVSTRENLDTCREFALAGVPGSRNGAWTFADVAVGDYVSFVYGAKGYDLYRVRDKRAVLDAETLPPWPQIEFRSGGSYAFPFRFELEPVRTLEENLVRSEFRYIAENLLLRGGYSRSHFQADHTTLQQVSQMGESADRQPRSPNWDTETGTARWVRRRGDFEPPEVNQFIEEILHVLLRRALSSSEGLETFVEATGFDELEGRDLEVLGERALPEGHLDVLVKDAKPVGNALQLPIEVKLNRCGEGDLDQLSAYVEQLEPECPGGVLVAETVPLEMDVPENLVLLRASFADLDMGEPHTLAEMQRALTLGPVER